MDIDEKKLREELKQTWEEAFKPAHEELKAEIAKNGEASAETQEKVDRIQTALDTLEVQVTKAIEIGTDIGEDARSLATKAFIDWCRKGDQAAPETKASLQVGDDSAGGFLAPSEYIKEILKGVIEFSPVREYARITSTTATSIKVPKRTGVFAATWTASAGTRAETTGLTYGLDEIPTHEMYALVDIENQLLEDAVFDMETELNGEFAEQFGVAEGAAFISGSGVGRPEGILSSPQLVEVHTATSDVFVGNDLIDLYYALKTAYAKNGTWAFNRGIMKAIRKFQDSVGNYLWQPGLAGLAPATVLDRPYFECPDLASAVADNAKIALFGDWKRGYRIVDRIVMSVQRDPYTQNTVGATRFIARKRVGGQLVIPEAIQVLDVT